MIKLLPGENSDYLLALGRFAQRFAVAETSLDLVNVLTFHHAEGANEINSEIPTALDQKITFLRKTHERLFVLRNLQEQGLKIASDFLSLKEARHFLIHGIGQDPGGMNPITKVRIMKSIPEEQLRHIPLSKLISLGDQTWDLAKETNDHCMRLIRTLLTDDQIDEAFRGITG